MMTCKRCRKRFDEDAHRCPYCGQRNPENSGVFQVSAVLISIGGEETVYRSMEDVPARLRSQIMKSTNSANSATILIADRRGRREIARVMRNLPGSSHRRLVRSILESDAAKSTDWLTPVRKRAILAAIAFCVIAAVALVFGYRW